MKRTSVVIEVLKKWARRFRPNVAPEALEPGSLRDALVALLVQLGKKNVDCALVGGLALAARGVVRGTVDIDVLIAATQEPRVHELMTQLGFETLDRGESVSSYVLDQLRVDFLLARRTYGLQMLERAAPVEIRSELQARVVQVEDLIALKLQALVSNPARGRDRADIEALLRIHHATVKLDLIKGYAVALGAERELNDIIDTLDR